MPEENTNSKKEVKRTPVNYRWSSLNWEFLKLLAEIAHYASSKEKYGSVCQYMNAPLQGEKSPMNHIAEHYRAYLAMELHDHFGTREHQLAAIAYNAMMEFFYLTGKYTGEDDRVNSVLVGEHSIYSTPASDICEHCGNLNFEGHLCILPKICEKCGQEWTNAHICSSSPVEFTCSYCGEKWIYEKGSTTLHVCKPQIKLCNLCGQEDFTGHICSYRHTTKLVEQQDSYTCVHCDAKIRNGELHVCPLRGA